MQGRETTETSLDDSTLSEEQKRRLRAVRRGYRAERVAIKDNGWQVEVTYLDGSTVSVSSKLLKLRSSELQGGNE